MASYNKPEAAPSAGWSSDPLLSKTQQAPHFLRTQWDEASAQSFGPWRVAPKA